MKRILGLDLGTTSIGWAVVDQATNESEKSIIIKLGVRVNPLTADEKNDFESGKSISTTAERTRKRSMRRNLQRYKLRRDALISILKKSNFINDETNLCEVGNKTTFETYRLRAKAATEEISLEDFARVLLMINKKRGYKSNRKVKRDEKNAVNEGQLIDGMEIARKLHDDNLTPGQYTYKIVGGGQSRYEPSFYRSDLLAEFDLIWEVQSKFYPDILTPEIKSELRGKNKKNSNAIFVSKLHITPAETERKTRLQTIYRWRSESVTKKHEIEVVAAVLVSINTQISESSGYLSEISDRSKALFFNNQTVGQYLMAGLDYDPHFRVKRKVFYRQDYLDEFEKIWETQAKYHPELTPELKEAIRDIVIFYQRKLKSQKGLISFCEFESRQIKIKTHDGNEKTITTGLRVAPKSSPFSQEFKIWQTINNLIIFCDEDKGGWTLNQEQRVLLFKELSFKKELKQNDILKLLGYNTKKYATNYKDGIQGNNTLTALMNAYKTIIDWSGHEIEKFDKMKASDKLQMVKAIFEGLGGKSDFVEFNSTDGEKSAMYKLWHLLYSYEGDKSKTGNDSLIKKIRSLTGLPEEYAKVIANVDFTHDYCSLSTKALKKILPFLKEGYIYSDACEKAGYRHSKHSLTREEIESRVVKSSIELRPKGFLRNPIVEKIINQMAHVVNATNEVYGPFDEIHIEMARNLKQTSAQRESDSKRSKSRKLENESIIEILQKEFGIPRPSRNDILRYRLYKELEPNGYKTLYTDTYISQEKLFSRDFDIEHIIPQAKLYDDSFNNKTLETRDANNEKGDKTAIDYVKDKYGLTGLETYKSRIQFLYDKANKKGTNKKYENLLTTEENIPGGFLNRDLNDTQYIAKCARQMLEDVCRVVVTTTGSITARLREDWRLIDVMKELNWEKFDKLGLTETYKKDNQVIRRIKDWTKRNDHRHHALDALTIAFTRPSHIQLINNVNASDGSKLPSSIFAIQRKELTQNGNFLPPMPYDELRRSTLNHLGEILVSIKSKNKVVTRNVNKIKTKDGNKHQLTLTPRGQLHKDTVFAKRLRYLSKEEKVDGKFNAEKIATVASRVYRTALLQRLEAFDGDAKKAFTGKNSPEKNPIFVDKYHSKSVPLKVKTIISEPYYTKRVAISNDLNIEDVVDSGIRRILQKRLEDYNNDRGTAFSNLEDNPIWLNAEKGIAIKRVTVKGVNNATPLHEKKDVRGIFILDESGNRIPTDYVQTRNNHHVAIFEDSDGILQEHIVTFYEALMCANLHLPIIDKEYNKDLGWKFLFTMKQNEMFVLPEEENGFYPEDIDLLNPANAALISKHLFRVQKLASKNYVFRHHLETVINDDNRLRKTAWERIQNTNGLRGIVKVRINHLGEIVHVGEG